MSSLKAFIGWTLLITTFQNRIKIIQFYQMIRIKENLEFNKFIMASKFQNSIKKIMCWNANLYFLTYNLKQVRFNNPRIASKTLHQLNSSQLSLKGMISGKFWNKELKGNKKVESHLQLFRCVYQDLIKFIDSLTIKFYLLTILSQHWILFNKMTRSLQKSMMHLPK